MINSYFSIKKFFHELAILLQGAYLETAFANSQNDLLLGFQLADKSYGLLKISFCSQATLYSWRANVTDFGQSKHAIFPFQQLVQKQIIGVKHIVGERNVQMLFENDLCLVLKLTGGTANVFFFKNNILVNHFKKNRKNDQFLSLEKLLEPGNELQMPVFFPAKSTELLKQAPTLKQAFIKNWLSHEGYDEAQEQTKKQILTKLFSLLNTPHWVFCAVQCLPMWLPLAPDSNAANDAALGYNFEGLLQFEAAFLRLEGFATLKQRLTNQIEKRMQRLQSKLEILIQKQKEQMVNNRYEEYGHLLLAQPHAIVEGGFALLTDFYRSGEQLQLPIDENLSFAENATIFYNKAKTKHLAKASIKQQLERLQQQLTETEDLWLNITTAESNKALLPIKKLLAQKEQLEQQQVPYKISQFQGFTLWVGKHAQSNDDLLRLAHKNDYWLHARNYAGSHVVVRANNKIVPKPVLEHAAALALYHSKGKNDSYAAVIYTQCKHVRKPKGAAPGKVIVVKEQVLMVAPLPKTTQLDTL